MEKCKQPEICEQKFKMIDDKFKVLHHRLDNLDEIKDVLIELKVLSTQQLKDNRERDIQIAKHSEVLAQMGVTLIHINKQFEDNQKDMDDLKEQNENNIIELKNNLVDLSKDNAVKISDIVKYMLFTILGIGGTLIITKIIEMFSGI